MILRDLLQGAEATLRNADVEVPERTARWLWQHVSGMSVGDCFLHQLDVVDHCDVQTFLALIQRRAQREPLQYLIGETEFCGLPFFVDQRVLIPRPETEQLVDLAFDEIERRLRTKDQIVVVDVGTGSGAIAIALAVRMRQRALTYFVRLFATDLSADALAVARRNAERHVVTEWITFCEGAYLSGIPKDIGDLDLIVSNPPYIPYGMTLQPEVVEWEPHLALFAEEDGLACYEELAQAANERLACDGSLAFEVGEGQAQAVERILIAKDRSLRTRVVSDFRNINRFVLAERAL